LQALATSKTNAAKASNIQCFYLRRLKAMASDERDFKPRTFKLQTSLPIFAANFEL